MFERTIEFTKEQLVARVEAPEYAWENQVPMHLTSTVWYSEAIQKCVVELQTHVYKENLETLEITLPSTWWDMFKLKYFKGNLAKWFPAKIDKRTFNFYALYPAQCTKNMLRRTVIHEQKDVFETTLKTDDPCFPLRLGESKVYRVHPYLVCDAVWESRKGNHMQLLSLLHGELHKYKQDLWGLSYEGVVTVAMGSLVYYTLKSHLKQENSPAITTDSLGREILYLWGMYAYLNEWKDEYAIEFNIHSKPIV